MLKIGIIREGKTPPDKRVPFSPAQCNELKKTELFDVKIQKSTVRAYADSEYADLGLEVKDNVSDCDILMGIKEVPVDLLEEKKTYFFFSHTIKKQPHNQKLIKALLEKKITMIDYECLRDVNGQRILGFGYYAGIVGTYNGLRAYGLRNKRFELKPAYLCFDYEELKQELKKVDLASGTKLLFTGTGRVGHGAINIMSELNIKKVDVDYYLTRNFNEPVYCQINYDRYYKPKNGGNFNKADFFANPQNYESDFLRFSKVTDIYFSCHYWDSKSPKFFTVDDMKRPDFKIKVIADITCDIDGSIPSTIRASTIENPIYGFNPHTNLESEPFDEQSVTIMAVDNLPCELPRDASEYFGSELFTKVMPLIHGDDPFKVLERATICREGQLMPAYEYLSDYAYGSAFSQ
jgi:hypothetical protein